MILKAMDDRFARIRGQLLPAPEEPPTCRHCGGRSERRIVRWDNPHGNANRPYYKCVPCGAFLVFDDRRGNLPDNFECLCGTPAKIQLSHKRGQALHLVCRLGRCDYFRALFFKESGEPIRLGNSTWAMEFFRHRII